MLDTSQHPSSDLDTMRMGAEPEMVEAVERERELRDIQRTKIRYSPSDSQASGF
jgi:hypothetical protein